MIEAYREQRPNIETAAFQETTLTPEETGFIKEAKKVITGHLARTILVVSAVLAGAGIVTAEKTGSFDPITNPVDSANHLVLDNLDRSYEQLIDKLPEVEVVSATHRPCHPGPTTGTIDHSSLEDSYTETRSLTPGNPAYGVCISYQDLSFGNLINDLIVTENPPGCPSPTIATAGGNGGDGYIGSERVYINWGTPCVDPGESVTFSFRTPCCGFVGWGTTWVFETDVPTPPTPVPGVGGIAKLPDPNAPSQATISDKSKDDTLPITAGLVAAASAITAAGTALYIRRNRSSK